MFKYIAESTTLTFRIGIIDITSFFGPSKFQLCWRVPDIKVFTPDTTTPIYWIAFQIKKRGLLTSINAFCSIGQSEQLSFKPGSLIN